MKRLRRRYGRATRLSELEERAELRRLLQHRHDLIEYVAGGPFCLPMSTAESATFTRLGRKYKYDREFEDALHGFEFKRASSRSPKKDIEDKSWRKYQ